MTINWWTLGLQAVNVLILIWLLSRLFWRPVAAAIVARQDTVQAMLDNAKALETKAQGIQDEVTKTRNQMQAERTSFLNKATQESEIASKYAIKEAAQAAEALVKTAQIKRESEAREARAIATVEASELAVDIARKLLVRLEVAEVHDRFLELFLEAISIINPAEKRALSETKGDIDLISAIALTASQKEQVATALAKAIGGKPKLKFQTNADLIAGFEMRAPHFVLHNSWQADLATILKDLNDAA